MSAILKSPNLSLVDSKNRAPWRAVRSLPLAQQGIIQEIGNQLFQEVGFQGVKEMYYLFLPKGKVPSTTIQNILSEFKLSGNLIREDRYEFHKLYPGYSPDGQLWELNGINYLIISDEFANYIYSSLKESTFKKE